ncbi:adenosylhomocysteinase [Micromonosporaceae bacterium Da 78-11]
MPGRRVRPAEAPGREGRRLHLAALGVQLTKLIKEQASYLASRSRGPYQSDHYRY